MNIAFPALLILLLILPGFIFNHAFYKTENIPLNFIPLTSKAIVSFIITCLLHIIWIVFAIYLLQFKVNFTLIFMLIASQGDKYATAIVQVTTNQIILTVIYLVSIYIAAYIIGKLLRWGIRKFKLDRKWLIFRIDSPWYYLFTMYDCNDNVADGVRIAAVVEIAGNGFLYVGWLDKFYLNNSGNLERLILVGARRREMKDDKTTNKKDTFNERFYSIDGDYFILKYAEIRSLNVQYLKIEDI